MVLPAALLLSWISRRRQEPEELQVAITALFNDQRSRRRFKNERRLRIGSANISVAASPSDILKPRYHEASDVLGRRPPEDATSPKSLRTRQRRQRWTN